VPGDVLRLWKTRAVRRLRPDLASWVCLGAALFAAFASLVCAWSQAPLNSGDEAAHLDYAIDVWHGRLPYFYDGLTNRPPFGSLPPVQWVAQHPPFFYAVLAPVVGPLWDAGHPYAAVLAGRSANAGFAAATVLAVGWAARRVVPRRPDVAAVAAVIVSLTSMFLLVGGAIYNDLPNMALGALAVGVGASALRSGLSTRLVVAGTVVATLGMLTRLTFVVFVLAVLVAFLLARWRRSGFWTDWRGHVVAAVAVVAAPTAASGWFWLRNIRLMGTIVGNDVAWGEEHLHRVQRTPMQIIGDAEWWRSLFALYAGHLPGDRSWTYSLLVLPLVLALLVGLAVATRTLWRRVRGPSRADHPLRGQGQDGEREGGRDARGAGPRRAARALPDGPRSRAELVADVLVATMLVGLTLAVLVGQVRFSTTGGAPNVRYSLAVMPMLAIPMAIGLTGVGRVVSATVTVVWMEVTGYVWFQIQDLTEPAFGVDRTLEISRLTFTAALVCFAAVVVGVVVLVLRRGGQRAVHPRTAVPVEPVPVEPDPTGAGPDASPAVGRAAAGSDPAGTSPVEPTPIEPTPVDRPNHPPAP